MAYRNDWIRLIRALAPKYGLDHRALLAVASAEGLSGAVGDGGHAFGPFQLNDAGGVITGRKGNHRAFAESPAGIEWALQQIAQVARGQHGAQAINSIVRRFERPADPNSEVTRALAAYGQFGGAMPAPQPPEAGAPIGGSPGVTQGPDVRRLLAGQLASGKPIDWLGLARSAAMSRQQAQPATPTAGSPATRSLASAAGGGSPPGGLAEAFYDPLGSYDNGRFGGPIGNHNDHVHLSITNPQTMLAAIKRAQGMGLRVGENPYTDPVDPVHVNGSFHYKTFGGKYGGKRLGEAIDVSGSSKAMAAYYRWATRNLR